MEKHLNFMMLQFSFLFLSLLIYNMPQVEDIKKNKNRYLRISSEDRTAGTGTAARFTVSLPQSGQTIDRVTGYSLKYASCPNVFDNIPAYANTLVITKQTGAVVHTITCPVGQYTSTTFITALQTAINAAIGPDTVAITISAQNRLTFTWTGDSYSFTFATSTIADKIGLTADIAFAAASTMPNIINLVGESEVWIHSRTLNQSGLTEASGNFSVVGVLPLSVPYGGVAHMFEQDAALSQINFEPRGSVKSFRSVDITLRNRTGTVLTLPSNFGFTAMFKLYHK
jgi:hypothetical protein